MLNKSPPRTTMASNAQASSRSAVAVTMLLGTSVAREAEAWKAALLYARDDAERHLLPDTHLRNALTMTRTQRERSAKTKLFADLNNHGAACVPSPPQPNRMVSAQMPAVSQESQDTYWNGVSGHPPLPHSPHTQGVSKASWPSPLPSASRAAEPALMQLPNPTSSSKYVEGESAHRLGEAATEETLQSMVDSRSRHVRAGSLYTTHRPSSTSDQVYALSSQNAQRPQFGRGALGKGAGVPATVSANHLYLSSDVKDLISEVMQHHPEFGTRNDAIRAALRHLDLSTASAPSPPTQATTRAPSPHPSTSTSTTAATGPFSQWIPSLNASSARSPAMCNQLRAPPRTSEGMLEVSGPNAVPSSEYSTMVRSASQALSPEYSDSSQTSHNTPVVKRPNSSAPFLYGVGTPGSLGRPPLTTTTTSSLGLAMPWGTPPVHAAGVGTADINYKGFGDSSNRAFSPSTPDDRHARRDMGVLGQATVAREQSGRAKYTHSDPLSFVSNPSEQSWLGTSALQQSHDSVILASPVIAQRPPETFVRRGQTQTAQDFLSFYRHSRAQAHASGLQSVPSFTRSPGFPSP